MIKKDAALNLVLLLLLVLLRCHSDGYNRKSRRRPLYPQCLHCPFPFHFPYSFLQDRPVGRGCGEGEGEEEGETETGGTLGGEGNVVEEEEGEV